MHTYKLSMTIILKRIQRKEKREAFTRSNQQEALTEGQWAIMWATNYVLSHEEINWCDKKGQKEAAIMETHLSGFMTPFIEVSKRNWRWVSTSICYWFTPFRHSYYLGGKIAVLKGRYKGLKTGSGGKNSTRVLVFSQSQVSPALLSAHQLACVLTLKESAKIVYIKVRDPIWKGIRK